LAWLIPISLALSLSLRPAYRSGEPFDYLVGGRAIYEFHAYCLEWERENGSCFLNYAAYGRRGLNKTYYMSYSTEVVTGKEINRQTILIGRDILLLGVGAAAVTHEYSNPRGAVTFSAPLPGDGSLRFTTDFNRIHVWDAETSCRFNADGGIVPFMEGHLLHDRRTYWRAEIGLEIRL